MHVLEHNVREQTIYRDVNGKSKQKINEKFAWNK